MRGMLKITAHWMCRESESEEKSATKSTIEWTGVKTMAGDSTAITHQSSAENVTEFVNQLRSYFGSDLRDLDNECHVSIADSDICGQVIKGVQLATGHYIAYEALSSEEKRELARLLNSIEPK